MKSKNARCGNEPHDNEFPFASVFFSHSCRSTLCTPILDLFVVACKMGESLCAVQQCTMAMFVSSVPGS